MTSLLRGIRQVSSDSGYYIPISSLAGLIYSYNGSTFSTANWTTTAAGLPGGGRFLSSINGPGTGLLKDMGKTVVSANRLFRKIQLAVSTPSTFGISGTTNNGVDDYLTGYIELGLLDPSAGGVGSNFRSFNFAPVAVYGR